MSAPVYVTPTPPAPVESTSFFSRIFGRRGQRRRPVILLIVGLFLGLVIGAGGSGSAAQAEDERLTTWESELSAQESELATTESDLAEREEAVKSRESGIETRSDAAATRESEVSARETAVAEAEAAVAAREADVAAREAAVTSAPAAAPVAPAADTGSSSVGGDGSAYYENCSAARAAGAAPILSGQPGYRSALDRDGDGIACE